MSEATRRGPAGTTGPHERLLAWLVTGSPGRGAAFLLDLSALLLRALRHRPPSARER